jgi:hypothetical protein
MTIVELFCTAIKKSYIQLVKEGLIVENIEKHNNDNLLYDEMMNGANSSSLFKSIISLNVDRIKGSRLHDSIMDQLNKTKEIDQSKKQIFNVMKNGIKKQVTID